LAIIHREIGDILEKERKARKKFYDSIRDGEKAEFINGQIIVHSPDTALHIETRKRISKLIDTHAAVHRLGKVLDEMALICLTRNDYMPDINFFGRDKAKEIEPGQLRFPAPDLAVETLSPSTARRDRGVKFDDYEAHGVSEYWIVDPVAQTVELFEPDALGKYQTKWTAHARRNEMVRSDVLPEFKAPARAFFEDEANLDALRGLLK
jgi:Uma2 family endonuclease